MFGTVELARLDIKRRSNSREGDLPKEEARKSWEAVMVSWVAWEESFKEVELLMGDHWVQHVSTQQPSSAIGHFVVADSCSEAFRFKSVYILANPESECVFFFDFPLPAHFAALTD